MKELMALFAPAKSLPTPATQIIQTLIYKTRTRGNLSSRKRKIVNDFCYLVVQGQYRAFLSVQIENVEIRYRVSLAPHSQTKTYGATRLF